MEKKGKIAAALVTAALVLFACAVFAGFHQAAKWQQAVRKEIQRLDWAVPLGHFESLSGGVFYIKGEPYFEYDVITADGYANKWIDKKGQSHDGEELFADFDEEEDEDDYEAMRKEEGYRFPMSAYWSDDMEEDGTIKGASLMQDGKVLFQTKEFYDIEEIGQGYYLASSVKAMPEVDIKTILKADITPAFGKNAYLCVGGFAEGLCYCEKITNGNIDNVPQQRKTESGYYDQKGHLVIPTGDSVYGTQFSEGRAVVYEEEKFYVIDKEGNKLVEKPLRKAVNKNQRGNGPYGGDLNLPHWKNRFVVFDGKYYGIMDAGGSWLLKPMFYDLISIDKVFSTISFGDKKGIVELREE